MALNKVLKAKNDSELLSYIINSDPVLSSEIDLPVQGQGIQAIGKLILSNERYKNAFINTINLIGLTVIDRNYWENPWEWFANRGTLNFGQSVRELIVDLAKVEDYNAHANDPTHFLANVVPDVYNYIHELNYQKFYKATTSDEQMAMAFNTEGGLMDLIEKITGSLYEGYKYDKYIVDKYQLCRRILDGTVTSIEIDNYSTLTPRQRVSFIKNISNKMTFRSPNYNPAGIRVATSFDNQIMIMNTDFEADMSTEVLATSYFIDEAKTKTNLALIDGFDNQDTARLVEVLGDAYVPFTDAEISALGNIPCVIIDSEWFQDYTYSLDNSADLIEGETDGLRRSDLYNPESMRNHHWLHTWKVMSTSPFKQAVVFTKDVAPAVSSVAVNPSTATVTPGQNVKLNATVSTTGFANKAVQWSITADSETTSANKATVDTQGNVVIPSGHGHGSSGTQGTYYVTISTALATDETVVIDGHSYTAVAADDTAAKQATAIAALFTANPSAQYTVTVGTSGNANRLSFVEKATWYGVGKPVVDDSGLTTGVITESTGTAGVMASSVRVRATSVFDTTKYAESYITVS